MSNVLRLPPRAAGPLHFATVAGEPGCRDTTRAPRLTGNPSFADCQPCRESRSFNSALRNWMRRAIREARHG